MEAHCEASSLGASDADVVAYGDTRIEHEPSLAVVTAKNFVSGIVGGGCEAIVGYPLETVKARMQTQQGTTGPIDCLRQTMREGGVGALYRGASPQILRSAIRCVFVGFC
jgi:hypothetical protein